MATPTLDAAQAHAEALTAAGVPTFVDPRKARANLPACLILPPTLRWDRANGPASIEWRLVALVDGPPGLDAWTALDDLVDRLAAEIVVTSAEPGAYTLSADERPLSAYIITAATE